MSQRLTIDEYAMLLAHSARLRSEDPYLKVGAAALSRENRVIATAYNGLKPGLNALPSFWADREARLPHMIHAEQNLCSLFVRSAAHTVAVTTLPCRACAAVLLAHDVRRVVYGAPYHRDDAAEAIFQFSDVKLVCVPPEQLTAAMLRLGAGVRVRVPASCVTELGRLEPLPGVQFVGEADPHDLTLGTSAAHELDDPCEQVGVSDLLLVSRVACATLARQFSHA